MVRWMRRSTCGRSRMTEEEDMDWKLELVAIPVSDVGPAGTRIRASFGEGYP